MGIVYVLDLSGQMRSNGAFAINKIERAIDGTPSDEYFDCALAAGHGAPTLLSRNMLRASAANKRRAIEFLEGTETSDSNDLAAAVNEACGLRPAMIWLLSDGASADDLALSKAIEAAKNAKVRINAVLDFAMDAECRDRLFAITRTTGGLCVTESGAIVVGSPRSVHPATRPARSADGISPPWTQ